MPVGPEHELHETSELLHRQAHPKMVVDGRASGSLFLPFPRDENRLSVDQGAVVTAEQALRAYRQTGRESTEVWSVSVAEVRGNAGLSAYRDPLPENPAHALIDFTPVIVSLESAKEQRKACERIAAQLGRAASARGRSFP